MASIFLRKATWYIKYYLNGKPIQKSLKTRDKTVAKFRKNEIENRLSSQGTPFADKDPWVDDCLEAFKRARAGIISTRAAQADHARIELFVKESRAVKLKAITPQLLKEHLDRRAVSNRTRNHTIRAVNTFLNFCVKQRMASENPIRGMAKYPIEEKEPRFLDPGEVRRLLDKAKSSEIYLVVALAVFTGMRLGEIQRLTWEDIDFEAEIIRVKRTKSKKFRNIPIHTELFGILRGARAKGPIWTGGPGYLIDKRFRAIRARLRKVPHFRFHDLRHTFASLLIRQGVDILTVSRLLGHSTIQTTQIYAHLYDDHVKDAIKKMSF